MSNFYGITQSIKLLPIRAISFRIPNETGINEYLNIAQLESESSFNIDEIVKNDSQGKLRILSNKFTGNFYIPHNEYKTNNLFNQLNTFRNASEFILTLGNASIPVNDITDNPPKVYNSNSGIQLKFTKFTYSYNIESVEIRPRLKLAVIGYEKNINNLFI